MDADATVDALQVAIAANVPVLITGDPGTGKTATVRALAEVHGAYLATVIASLRDPTDFAGLPVLEGPTGVRLAAPAWAHALADAAASGQEAWLFLDEITTAPPAVQAALLRVIHERVVGELELPQPVRVIAAANPPETAAGGWALSAPIANRFLHLGWALHPSQWADAMVTGFPPPTPLCVPGTWPEHVPAWRALIAAYIRGRGRQALCAVPAEEAAAGGAWPSPRTWDLAARVLAAADAAGRSDLYPLLATGAVGPGRALELLAYVREADLPDPETLLQDGLAALPERGDLVAAMLGAVVAAALDALTPERWLGAWRVLARAAELGAPDIAATAARALARAPQAAAMPSPAESMRPFMDILTAAGLVR